MKLLKIIVTALAVLIPVATYAAVTDTPVFVQTPRYPKAQLTNASGTTPVTLYVGGTNGTKVVGVFVSTTDTSAETMTLSVVRSAVTYILGTFTIPIGSGTVAGTPTVNILDPSVIIGLPVDSDGNWFIFLESTDTLQVSVGSAVTAGKTTSIHAVAADF